MECHRDKTSCVSLPRTSSSTVDFSSLAPWQLRLSPITSEKGKLSFVFVFNSQTKEFPDSTQTTAQVSIPLCSLIAPCTFPLKYLTKVRLNIGAMTCRASYLLHYTVSSVTIRVSQSHSPLYSHHPKQVLIHRINECFLEGWVDSWKDGWTNRWMDGWTDVVHIQISYQVFKQPSHLQIPHVNTVDFGMIYKKANSLSIEYHTISMER